MTKRELIRRKCERFARNCYRFPRGEVFVEPDSAMTREEKSGRLALLSASLLNLVAISCGALGLWRIGADLAWAGDFVVRAGFLSHWQVWIGAAAGMEYTSWWLTRYAGIMSLREVEVASGD
jgi:hypothetical protein